jgi:hypothetical protein
MLYTYIWGWRNAKEQNLTTMMWIWTGVIIVSVIISAVTGGTAMPAGGEVVPPAEPTEEALRFILRLFA